MIQRLMLIVILHVVILFPEADSEQREAKNYISSTSLRETLLKKLSNMQLPEHQALDLLDPNAQQARTDDDEDDSPLPSPLRLAEVNNGESIGWTKGVVNQVGGNRSMPNWNGRLLQSPQPRSVSPNDRSALSRTNVTLFGDNLATKILQKSNFSTASERDRRLRFYKAFRKIRQRKHREPSAKNASIEAVGIMGISNPRNSSRVPPVATRWHQNDQHTDPTTNAANDWETFITDYSTLTPQNQASLSPYGHDSSEGRSATAWKHLMAPQPYTYSQQHLLQQSQGEYSNNPASIESGSDRLPPIPAPRSTEASVHLVQVNPSLNPSPSSYSAQAPSAMPNPVGDQFRTSFGDYDESTTRFATNDGCEPTCDNYVEPSEFTINEQCNSLRLRETILQNIVERDAELSKRLIHLVSEREFGGTFGAVCGTGFFSYVMQSEEYCLASAMGVYCYVFASTCSQNAEFKNKMARMKKFYA